MSIFAVSVLKRLLILGVGDLVAAISLNSHSNFVDFWLAVGYRYGTCPYVKTVFRKFDHLHDKNTNLANLTFKDQISVSDLQPFLRILFWIQAKIEK
jgi:hypothetical protein